MAEILSDPFRQFEIWYQEAVASKAPFPDAMTLATATRKGRPSARVVLFKGISKGGFLLFTNYESQKGKELLQNPFAALVFHWPIFERQVRVEGKIQKLTRKESNDYFQKRPRGSQIGAWASHQSSIVPDRETLEKSFFEMDKKFAGKPVPLPAFWGGFRLIPEKIEFWISRENRLHDRFCFIRKKRKWEIVRLSP